MRHKVLLISNKVTGLKKRLSTRSHLSGDLSVYNFANSIGFFRFLFFSFIFLFFASFLSSCVSPDKIEKPKVIDRSTFQKIYPYSYESVWRAAQLALRYTVAVNNIEIGVLETDWIRGLDGFIPPHLTSDKSSGVRYKISISLVKGRVEKKESIRVTVIKKLEKQRDFFSAEEGIESDGLEERIIFYRIERELIIDEAIRKANRAK